MWFRMKQNKHICYIFHACLSGYVEAMMTGMIVLAVICGILSVLFVALCCYLCARRRYIKVCLDSASYPLRDSEMIVIRSSCAK